MIKYFYFYDLNEVLIDRYPAKIAEKLSNYSSEFNFIFIFSEKYRNGIPLKIPEKSRFYYLPGLSKSKLNELIAKYPPEALITIAQRIPDMWMLTYFNNHGYKTYLVQHGLWSDKLVRISLMKLLLKKFYKFLNYSKYVVSICRINDLSKFRTFYELYRFLLKEDIDIPETTQLHNDKIRAQKSFVFDDSWDNYYIIKYGYKKENLIYIGNPDFLLLKKLDRKNKEDAVCYLCQSLVEDGRFEKQEYQRFLKDIKQIALHKKLYIKLHPRSKIEIYNDLENINNIEFTEDLPVCKYYIGHYTGLLATVAHISDDILIWNFPDHHVPEYFFQFGNIITNKVEDLHKFIFDNYKKSKQSYNKKLSESEILAYDPIDIIAKSLMA